MQELIIIYILIYIPIKINFIYTLKIARYLREKSKTAKVVNNHAFAAELMTSLHYVKFVARSVIMKMMLKHNPLLVNLNLLDTARMSELDMCKSLSLVVRFRIVVDSFQNLEFDKDLRCLQESL